LASIVAHAISTHILPIIDFGIDYHTGGASRTNYPQLRIQPGNPVARELATHFAAPLLFDSALIEGSLRKAAIDLGKTILVYEGGESLRFDQFAITEGVAGAQRVLKA
ncbi:succinylglutamate desuccinylase/aspartoacylase family protein, partial [Arthrospira platensis SPKY1]|nr:succinylglutamate desuccinylase/aspartoacylase family protein [Arthrospira platensis SPKY1]